LKHDHEFASANDIRIVAEYLYVIFKANVPEEIKHQDLVGSLLDFFTL